MLPEIARTDLHERCNRMAMRISTRTRSAARFKTIRVASPRPQARSLSPADALIQARLDVSFLMPCSVHEHVWSVIQLGFQFKAWSTQGTVTLLLSAPPPLASVLRGRQYAVSEEVYTKLCQESRSISHFLIPLAFCVV